MKKTIVTFFTLATLLCFVDYSQAQQITLSQGIFERGGPYHIQSPFEPFTGNFLFTALNTRVSGNIVSNSSGVSYTEGLVDCCIYGRRLEIRDLIGGRTSKRQSKPLILNNQQYDTVYYQGDWRFGGGLIVPSYLSKKASATITVPANLTGSLTAYPDLTYSSVIFYSQLNMRGRATITIQRRNDTQPDGLTRFWITGIKYELAQIPASK